MKHRILNNQKGSTLVGALLAMMVLGFTGMAVVETSTSANLTSVNEIQSNQALYIGNAGIEQAKYKLNQGLSPDVANQSFGMGNFTIVSDPAGGSFQVTGQVGSARKVQTIGTNFSNNCVALDLTEAYVEGTHLVNAKLIKFCNAAAIVTGMRIDWDWGDCESDADATTECVPGTYGDYSEDETDDEADDDSNDNNDNGSNDDDNDDDNSNDNNDDDDNSNDNENSGRYAGRSCSASSASSSMSESYSAYEDPDHEGKILICHVPPGNPGNAHTLSVSVDGWEHGHNGGNGSQHNMDSLGACDGYQGEVQNDDEGNDDDNSNDNDNDDNGSNDNDDNDNGNNDETCNATELSIYQCLNDVADQRTHGGAHVVSIGLSGNTIYDPSDNMGTPALPGADGAETIDTDDMTLSTDGTYLFTGPGDTPTQYITFDTTLQAGKWYEVTVTFADGSELTQSLIAEAADSDDDADDEDETSGDDSSDDESAETPVFVVNDDGTITADDNEEVSIEVDGSEIYSSRRNEISVQVELGTVQTNGSITYTRLYSWADVDGGESYSTGSGAGSSYVLRATAVISSTNTVQYASTNRVQVISLVDGDQAPDLPTQSASFANFLNNYINPSSGLVSLESNEVLMLFELDANITTNPVDPNIDFDDLAVVLTFDRTESDVYYRQVGDQLRFLEKNK